MRKVFLNAFPTIKAKVSNTSNRAKLMMLGAAVAAFSPIGAFAQDLAGTGYDAGNLRFGGSCVRAGQVHSLCCQPLLRTGWYRCHCRCHLRLHRHECVRNGCMINTSLARG